MSIRRLVETVVGQNANTMIGKVASGFYQLYDGANNWTWACDVDIGIEMASESGAGEPTTTTVLTDVPIATNNKDVLYAQNGWPVTLQKMGNGKWSVIGLAKAQSGETLYLFVSFDTNYGKVASRELRGYYTRLLTYEEIDTYGDYGDIPYGAMGRFRASDNSFVELVEG